MNFEDPFANDLKGFRSVAAGLEQATQSTSGSSLGRVLGSAASSAASPILSPSGFRGQSGAISSGLGVGSPIFGNNGGGGAGEMPIFPSTGSSAPVAGRRSRGPPSAASPFSAAPSSVPPGLQNRVSSPSFVAEQPQLFPPPQAAAPLPVTAAPSALSWLDDVNLSSPPPVSRHQGPPPLSPASPQPLPAQTVAPSFLNFDAAEGSAGPATLQPQNASPHRAAGAALTAPVNAAALEEERRRSELRDLYATLTALDTEQQRLDDRLDTRQLKEETELLELETSVLIKKNELADKEEELATKHAELSKHTEGRLAALSTRYAQENEAQSAEVESLDGARFEKQLQQIRSQCKAVEETVKGLREQAALALALEPFSEKGVRVAVAAATSAPAPPKEQTTASEETVESGVSSPSLEMGLKRAVEILRAYCDQRMNHARERLVDYVHTQSLEAAHAVRRTRERSWADDAVQHKTIFSQYMVDMMQRYMAFYKERALLKQRNITALQGELQATAAELRGRAAARLQDLLTNVTAKMALSTDRQTQSTEEAKKVLQMKASAIAEADVAMATTQRKELERRLLTEAQSRRQRFQAEEQSLAEQLQRLRRSSEASMQESSQGLLGKANSSGLSLAQSLEEEVAALKMRLSERLHGDAAPSSSVLRTASSAAHMHCEELLHVVRHALAEEAARQHSLTLSHQRCSELRDEVLLKMREEVVERLQHTRCVQHAHQSRIDAQRKIWEAAHRQNLAAACSLILPVSGSSGRIEDASYTADTYAAPQDVASIALMDVIRDKLQSRDDARRRLFQTRKDCTTRCFRLLDTVRAQQEMVQTTWDDVWSASQTHQAQQTTSHEVQLEVEKAIVAVTVQQQIVERDRRNTERECRRVAEATRRAHAEAAQCGVDAGLLCVPTDQLDPSLSVLRSVDPSVINRLPPNSKFTAVHTSNNAAARAHNAELPLPSAVSATHLSSAATPPLPPSVPSNKTTCSERGAAAPSSVSYLRDLSVGADASNATATQPWSSTLLRAEQLLSSPNVNDDHDLSAAPSALHSAEGSQAVGDLHVGRDGSTRRAVSSEAKNSSSASQRGTSRTPVSTSKSTATEEKHRSSSTSQSLEIPPHFASSTWHDTDTGLQQQQQQLRRVPPSSPRQLQHQQGRISALLETWSTLEDFHSGVDRTGSAIRDHGAPDETTTLSFDDSTNFVDLLSCDDSPASSRRAH